MTETYFGFRFILLLMIIAANGFFAGAEVALLTVRGSRLRYLADQGEKGAAAALSLLANPERLLSVVQVGVTLSSLGLGWAGEDTLYQLFVGLFQPALSVTGEAVMHGVSFVLSFMLMTFGHVVLGEVVPKNLAIEKADRLACIVAPALLVFYKASGPFVYILERSSLAVSRLLGLTGGVHGGGHSAEEIKTIVSLSRGSQQLTESQEDIIHNAVDLENLYVREIMVPRNEIVSVPRDATLDQVLTTMVNEQHSRLPVYEGKPENLVGIIIYKDLLPVWVERRRALFGRRELPFHVDRMLRGCPVVPETKPVLQMLDEFRRSATHMAFVVDEFGTIVGLLTVEDILEQIVGEIADEYDAKPIEPEHPPEVLELDGATLIRDLDVQHGIEIPADAGFETLAGFLLQQIGDIPETGQTVEHGGRRYTVAEMQRNRIVRVRVDRAGER
ncbi:MAG: hemolysin family protein [Bryobacteraceae bacterium]